MSRLDYSKWNHIEVSDDEDDTHPNIDTPSLFRWRHQARMERMDERKKEKESFEQESAAHRKKKREMEKKLKELELAGNTEAICQLNKDKAELEKQDAHFRSKEEELAKKERIVNKGKSKTNEEKHKKMVLFMDQHEYD